MDRISQDLLFRAPFMSLIIIYFSMLGCSKSSKINPAKKTDADKNLIQQKKEQEIQVVDGRYISIEDSLAGVEIKNDTYIMFYEGHETVPSDHYQIIITDSIAFRDTTYRNGKYLTLQNQSMTLKYAIDYWQDDYISLIYLPRGNFLNSEFK
ncbi:hypothetical protein [Rhodohalobacter sp.]|uniref:hypothetical protein n=1 Tax=Rhodohalobacter sp. TaxID=1974210 RepID=UPI003568C462